MYYKARYYHPTLGRFVSADTIVPGMANGAGGGVATLGYDPQTRLTPLTVNLGEFAQQINAENREILQFGWFFQWDARTRREHNVPRGPVNPQALNRYAYVLNNPLRYVDPTGHSGMFPPSRYVGIQLTSDASNWYLVKINTRIHHYKNRAKYWAWGCGIVIGVGLSIMSVNPVAGAIGGGLTGKMVEQAAGGWPAEQLQGLHDYLAESQAYLKLNGITTSQIKIVPDHGIFRVYVMYGDNQVYISASGEDHYTLMSAVAVNDFYEIYTENPVPGAEILYDIQ